MVQTRLLPTFEEARPLNENDQNFIKEIRTILEKHGNLDRFGLCLLHDHFPIAEDEILMESHDKETRKITIVPMKRSELPEFKPTMWNLSTYETIQAYESKFWPQVVLGCAEDKCK